MKLKGRVCVVAFISMLPILSLQVEAQGQRAVEVSSSERKVRKVQQPTEPERQKAKPKARIALFSDRGSLRVTPAGMPYFVEPVSVVPFVNLIEEGVGKLEYELRKDGVAFSEGEAIEGTGFYEISLAGEDQAGSQVHETATFQIRSRPLRSAIAVVKALEIEKSPAGSTYFHARILLSSSEFNARKISLPTLSLSIANEEGKWLDLKSPTVAGLAGRGAEPVPGPGITDCYIEVSFIQEFQTDELLSSIGKFLVLGSGETGGEFFDLMTFPFDAKPNSQPEEYLLGGGPNLDDIDCVPPDIDPPQVVPCVWKDEFMPPIDRSTCAGVDYYESLTCDCHYGLRLVSQDGREMYADGVSRAHGSPGCGWNQLSCAGTSSGTFKYYRSGDNCCETCTITAIFRPSFRAAVRLDPPGSASASGKLSVTVAQCGSTEAEGEISIVDGGEPLGVGSGGVEIDFEAQDDGYRTIAPSGTPLICVMNTCELLYVVGNELAISVYARTGWLNSEAKAEAWVGSAKLGKTIWGTISEDCGEGPVWGR